VREQFHVAAVLLSGSVGGPQSPSGPCGEDSFATQPVTIPTEPSCLYSGDVTLCSPGRIWWTFRRNICDLHRITGFLNVFNRLVFERTRRFRNWICFRPQVKVGEKTPTHLGPLERANLSHWTPLSDLHSYVIIWDQVNSAGNNKKLHNKNCDEAPTCVELGKKSKNPVILCVMHHHQNHLESTSMI
jgi:hypothetical protein